jgi:hypothetical protein
MYSQEIKMFESARHTQINVSLKVLLHCWVCAGGGSWWIHNSCSLGDLAIMFSATQLHWTCHGISLVIWLRFFIFTPTNQIFLPFLGAWWSLVTGLGAEKFHSVRIQDTHALIFFSQVRWQLAPVFPRELASYFDSGFFSLIFFSDNFHCLIQLFVLILTSSSIVHLFYNIFQ